MAGDDPHAGASDPGGETLLGPLERAVMDEVWQRNEATVSEVHGALAHRELAYTTVMTVMTRLAEKGVLTRKRTGRAFLYRPVQPTRAAFVQHKVREKVQRLLSQFGDLAMAEIVSAARSDEEQLRALRALMDAGDDDQEYDQRTDRRTSP